MNVSAFRLPNPIGSKLGIDANGEITRRRFQTPCPPLIRMDENIHKKVDGAIRRSTMKAKSLVAPKLQRRRKMDESVKAKIEKLVNL